MNDKTIKKVLKNKFKLKENPELSHIYIAKYLPKTEYMHLKSLREQIKKLVADADSTGMVEFRGEVVNIKTGRFKIEKSDIVYCPNST